MKKILLLILFLLTAFETAFSEQINQSSSNYEPIELETRKEQVLFDKTEAKILLKDKNVSDLDKDSEVELSLKNKNSDDSNQNVENPALEKYQFENSTKQEKESKSEIDNEDSVSNNDKENNIDSDSAIKPSEKSQQSLPENQKLSESKNENQEAAKIEEKLDAHSESGSVNKGEKLMDKKLRPEQELENEEIERDNVQISDIVKTEIIDSTEQNSEQRNLERKPESENNQAENVTENDGETNTLDKNFAFFKTEDMAPQIENPLDSNTHILKKSTETSVQNDEENFKSKNENIHPNSVDTSENEKNVNEKHNDSPSVQTDEEKTDMNNGESSDRLDILTSNQQESDNQSIGEIAENYQEKTVSNEPSEFLSHKDEPKIEAESDILESNKQELDKSKTENQSNENLIQTDEDHKNTVLDEMTVNVLQESADTKLRDEPDNLNAKEETNTDLNIEAEKANEFVTNLVGKEQMEKNLDLKDKNEDIALDSGSTETLFIENVSESPVNFESTTTLTQNFDDKIEESTTHLDSLSKKFSSKIKKLKEHNFKSAQEEFEANRESSNSTNDRVCANLHNFKQILSENVEPLYLPIVSLLPEDIQLVLLNESFAGIPNASLIFLALNIFLVTSFVFLLMRIIEGKKINLNASLNNQLILQTNRIRQLEFDLKTFASLIEESEQKKSASEALIGEKDSKIKELNEKLSKSLREQEFNEKELSKLKTNETKLIKESNQLRTELNSLNEVFTQQKSVFSEQIVDRDTKIIEFTQEIERQKIEMAGMMEKLDDYAATKEQNTKLNTELNECLNTVEILKNSLSIKNSSRSSDIDDYVQVDSQDESSNVDSLMQLAQLQMEYKNLQSKYDDLISESEAKNALVESLKNEIESRKNESGEWDTRLKKFEKQIKENEMQIRLLNELRERDTKQHVKALSELDLQLKKKTADAEKVGHYMEQLRVKQERIQELEANLTRVEKQSNVERQTFEKQAHENWLNAKKLDKELRETRTELDNLRERMREIESGGVNQENLVEEPPRPPSTSSNPGGMFPPNGPGFMPFMRQPAFRYPFPPINPTQAAAFMQHLEQQRLGSTSPNQDSSRVPNMPPPHILQRFLQAQQFMPQQMANSANSSQQVSPTDLNDSNILASTALNDSSMNNIVNAADNTQNMMNEFDFSSNSGYFNQNGTETCNGFHPDQYSNENVNSNFNV